MEYHRRTVKREVKQRIRETRPRPLWTALVYGLISAGGAGAAGSLSSALAEGEGVYLGFDRVLDALFNGGDVNRALGSFFGALQEAYWLLIVFGLLSLVGGLVNYLWSGLIGAGYARYSLDLVRGRRVSIGMLFSGFPRFGKVIFTHFLTAMFSVLWTLLFGVCFAILLGASILLGVAVAPWLGIVLGLVSYVLLLCAMIWLSYRYMLVNLVMMDQEVFGLEAITRSKRLMKGNTLRMLVLNVSFVGYYLLGIAVVLVGMLTYVLIVELLFFTEYLALSVILLLAVTLLMTVALLFWNAWLTPYIHGCVARFYEYAQGRGNTSIGWQLPSDDSFGYPRYPKLD